MQKPIAVTEVYEEMRVIKSYCLGRLHELAVNKVYDDGIEVITEDGDKTIELEEPLCLICDKPWLSPQYSEKSCIKENMMETYAENLIFGSKSVFEYDYHSRLFEYDGINQIEKSILSRLSSHPTSRRAVAITWQPENDICAKDVPCLQFIQCKITHGGRLDMTVLFRSNDILLACGANMYALTKLQKRLAERLEIEQGTYTHIAVIPHIYVDRDKDELKRFIDGSKQD